MGLHFPMLLDQLEGDGGFTVRRDGKSVREGFAVSVHPDHERVIRDRDVTVLDLYSFCDVRWDALHEPGAVFGAWRNPLTGHTHLDVTRVVQTHKTAYALAAHHGQLAYFDLANGKTIRLDRPGLSVAA